MAEGKAKNLYLGTDLTAPKRGVTVKDLLVVLQACTVKGSFDARSRLRALSLRAKSHILLTGNVLTSTDLTRIHFAIDEMERQKRHNVS